MPKQRAQQTADQGYGLLDAGDGAGALSAFSAALRLDPRSARSRAGLGWAYVLLSRPAEALAAFEAALIDKHGEAHWHYGRGLALFQLDRLEESAGAYRRAIDSRPDFPEAWSNLTSALQAGRLLEEALLVCEQALLRWPQSAVSLANLGAVCSELGQLERARQAYRSALEIDADFALAHFHLSTLDLLAGNYAEGLRRFEWRTRLQQSAPPSGAVWARGQSLSQKRVLVRAEQGLGDTIQFCRYLPLLADSGASVVFAAQPPIVELMRTLDRRIEVVDASADAGPADFSLPLMSLPSALGAPFPLAPPADPYLHASPEREAFWRGRIGAEGFKIGVAWRGSRPGVHAGRSWPLAALTPLASLPGVRLISLQKGEGEQETAGIDWPIETLGPDFDRGPAAFLDSAAVMSCLDLVISADSAIAHLAGAMGRPAWVALAAVPDWRWLLERNDTDWYPNMTLFRQPRPGDWAGVFERMRIELEKRKSTIKI